MRAAPPSSLPVLGRWRSTGRTEREVCRGLARSRRAARQSRTAATTAQGSPAVFAPSGGAPGAGGGGEERARLSHTSEPTRSSARRTRARIACGTGTKECRFLESGGPRCAERTGVVPRAEMRRWFPTAA